MGEIATSLSHLLDSPALLLLLLNAALALVQQVLDVGFGVAVLGGQLLLQLQGLRVALVLLLQAEELPPQGGLPGDVHDGAGVGQREKRGVSQLPECQAARLALLPQRGPSDPASLPSVPRLSFLTAPIILFLTAAVLVLRLVCRREQQEAAQCRAEPGTHPHPSRSQLPTSLTLLPPLLAGAVDVVLELDADLPLGGLVADEGELEQLLRGGPVGVGFDQAVVNEVDELLGPAPEWEEEAAVTLLPTPSMS